MPPTPHAAVEPHAHGQAVTLQLAGAAEFLALRIVALFGLNDTPAVEPQY